MIIYGNSVNDSVIQPTIRVANDNLDNVDTYKERHQNSQAAAPGGGGGGGDLVSTMSGCVCREVKEMGPFLASSE